MLSNGLRIARGPNIAFEWDLTISNIEFQMRIEGFDSTFIKIPRVTFRNLETLPKNLIHINFDKSLCYLDPSSVYLDQYDPESTLSLILDSIRKTLQIITTPEVYQHDFLFEFDAYWQADYICYLLADGNNQTVSNYTRKSESLGSKIEFAISGPDTEQQLEKWLKIREVDKKEKINSNPVIKVNFTKPPKLQLQSSVEWPPKNWKTLYNWLLEEHLPVADEISRKLSQNLAKGRRILFILFSFKNGENDLPSYFGVYVKFGNELKSMAQRLNSSKKPGRRKEKIKLKTIRDGFKAVTTEAFSRIWIQDTTEKFILSRNLPTTPLLGSRIAVIGAGTIGSNLINLLVKSGAGAGSKSALDIFDSDVLTTANLARHLLGETYVGCNKAEALQRHFETQYSWSINIKTHCALQTPISIAHAFENYELIIDATGEQQFSTYLTSLYRKYRNAKPDANVNLLYGWVDANGLATRALLDDGEFGCYRCLKHYEKGELTERYPLIKSKSKPWPEYATTKFACGNSFTPYAESVSMTAASLIHSSVLDFFSGAKTPRFRHISLHSSVRDTKSQNVTQLPDCPCCK